MKAVRKSLSGTGRHKNRRLMGESRLMAANGKMDVCYNVRTAVDAKHKLVVEFEVINEGTGHNQLTPVVERTKTVLGTETLIVVADAGYDSVRDIARSMLRGAVPYMAGTESAPVSDGKNPVSVFL
jgi:hypothetical protein